MSISSAVVHALGNGKPIDRISHPASISLNRPAILGRITRSVWYDGSRGLAEDQWFEVTIIVQLKTDV